MDVYCIESTHYDFILTAATATTTVPITAPIATTVTIGTVPIDPCLSQPCLNSGTCIGGFSQSIGYVCLCVEQYTGSNCDIEVETATSKI